MKSIMLIERSAFTFKDGSVTLSAGPWGPLTGSTSRDTLPFVTAL